MYWHVRCIDFSFMTWTGLTRRDTESRQTWESVAEQLSRALAEGKADEDLRPLVRRWCDAARVKQLPPERLLVIVKRQLGQMPVLHAQERPSRDMLSERIITMCIDEYFSRQD